MGPCPKSRLQPWIHRHTLPYKKTGFSVRPGYLCLTEYSLFLYSFTGCDFMSLKISGVKSFLQFLYKLSIFLLFRFLKTAVFELMKRKAWMHTNVSNRHTHVYFWKSGRVSPFVWKEQITFKIFIQLLLFLDNQESACIGGKVSAKDWVTS